MERFENIALKLDYLAIFRTRFSETKIHRAIISALGVLHRTYDYLFNFYSDQSFVCSELVTKSYLKEFPEDEGITISLTRIGSGLTYPPNEFCRKAAIEKNLPNPELSPVIFIDCSQKEGRCFVGIEDDLFESYKRPRLSFFLK